MKITFGSSVSKTDALVLFTNGSGKLLPAGEKADQKAKGAIAKAIKATGFKGACCKTLLIPGVVGMGHAYILVVGLGDKSDASPKQFEKIGNTIFKSLSDHAKSAAIALDVLDTKKVSEDIAADRLATGLKLFSYRFEKYYGKKSSYEKPLFNKAIIVGKKSAQAKKLFAKSEKIIDGVFLTRDLVTEAPNVLYPESFAKIIRKELTPLGVKVTILDHKDMQKLGMGGLLAIGMGSARPPKLVIMEYNKGKKSQKPIAFVGKGVTFDTGGISIKPAAGMWDMKFDMGGAGTVVGTMKALAGRKAKANIIGVVALAENMPSDRACRPGDIVKTMSGQTVEIQNTDAEGRMILSDALWYTQIKYKPTHIVDLATLTGAIIVALGHEYAGVFSNDDKFARDLIDAGTDMDEHMWQMPMCDAWNKEMDAQHADIKNIGNGRDAGSATAAHFLKRFIQDGVKWTHLDIAGVAWRTTDKLSAPKGASGFGVRLLDHFVSENIEK